MKRILVVDDDAALVNSLIKMLQENNFEVLVAYDGLQGLEMAQRESPELIILDVMLPKLDGYKICRILKFDEKYRNIPIILFTGRAEDKNIKDGFEVGADAYITKPVDWMLLLNAVNKLSLRR